MMMVAFMMHPWVAKMKTMNVDPRTLADYLLILAAGLGHERRFRDAYLETFRYMSLIGARMAPGKSYTISSNENTRSRLRAYLWEPANSRILVSTNM